MHQLRTHAACRRFRWAALWFVAKCLLVLIALPILLLAFVQTDWQLTLMGLSILATAGVSSLIRIILGQSARCPLCMVPVFLGNGCSKHRSARTILGSHRLRLALAILFLGHFRCPYCGEPTCVSVPRVRNRR